MEGVPDDDRGSAEPAENTVHEAAVVGCMPGVRAMILRMTRDVNLTNDLTQDVMMAMLVAIREGRVKQLDALAGYVHETARHLVYAAGRKMRPLAVENVSETDSVWTESVPTPLDLAEEDEQRRLALEVLDELPAQRDRELIVGFYVDGLPKADLMQRLSLGADQFDKVIFRARTRLRDRLREKMNGKRSGVGGSAPAGVHASNKPRNE